ncbi:hypothetical protein GCM10009784_18030 [Arthrobacter parietis]|uniref:DUF4352 domain-containing protein n=2 Tax=Arthrobacter TaxID=1663 RepID=A0ABT6CVJ2_9MICC|nr:hypothetical protein [Arthrobacter vasquezii]MDF9278048.1 hypothetical protein [Arthrobacter vasquezii]
MAQQLDDRRVAHRASRPRHRMLIPAALLIGVLGGATWVLTNNVEEEPAAMLGASDTVDGGIARINGILPLESDGWVPPSNGAALETAVPDGAHRVRVLLELTALEPEGIAFSAADYFVDGLGTGEPHVIWASPSQHIAEQGETIDATLVFEIPNKALALVLSDDGEARLSLGTDHHTAGQ